jgi:Fe(3+) dicitrate transport protein
VAAEDTYTEEVTIIAEVADLAGAGAVIANEDLQKAMDTDIQKILTAVPGLYMRTEEGYGLRPNISIRGTAIERSAKVTIMEDGVLVAPSPYTSSALIFTTKEESTRNPMINIGDTSLKNLFINLLIVFTLYF